MKRERSYISQTHTEIYIDRYIKQGKRTCILLGFPYYASIVQTKHQTAAEVPSTDWFPVQRQYHHHHQLAQAPGSCPTQ